MAPADFLMSAGLAAQVATVDGGTAAVCLALVVAFGQPAGHHDFAKFYRRAAATCHLEGADTNRNHERGRGVASDHTWGKGSSRDAKPSAVTVQSPIPRDTETPGAD